MAELIGPNVYLQALVIAVAFVALGKIADKSILAELTRIAEYYPELTTRRALL